ncbi:MAG: tetratricopeptide repeat protein, partial [Bacteroidales bacterium]
MKILPSDKFRFFGLCLLLLAGLIIVYSNHFKNPFHFDDEHTIVNNIWIRSLKNIPRFYVDGKTTSNLPQNQAYRPGLTTLNTIDYAIAKWNPLGIKNNFINGDKGLIPFYFHLSIFTCFILQAFLMFLLIKKILDVSFNHKWNQYFTLFIVAFYCYHTAMAETVNYVISRSDGFSTLMLLLAFIIYIYFPQKRKYHFYLVPYVFGFFVKEPTLMFGPILFFYILLFEKHTDLSKIFKEENLKKIWSSFKSVVHIILIGAGLYLFEYFMTPKTWTPGIISRWSYFITQPFVIVQYFKTFILPTELSADTDWLPLTSIFNIRFLMGLMFITGMIWLSFRLSVKATFRPITFGIFWFFLALVPTSTIIPLSEVLNDHRVYFPYIGLALAFSTAIIYLIILRDEKRFIATPWLTTVTGIFMIGLLCSHAYGTHQRNKVWSSYESLWYDVTQKSPNNGRGMMNYALSQMRIGNYIEAKKYFEKARVLSPNYSLVYINLGVLHSALNDPTGAEQYFKKAIDIG